MTRIRLAGVALAGAAALALACGRRKDPEPADVTAAALDREVFAPNCAFASCHGGLAPAAGLDFSHGLCTAMVNRPSCLFPDRKLVVRGDAEQSFLVQKLVGNDLPAKPATGCGVSDARMPLGGMALPAAQIDRVRAWISAGAPCDVDVMVPDDAGVGDGGGDGADDGGQGLLPPDGGAVLALSPPSLRLLAGERATLMLTLAPLAPAGGATVVIDTSDRDALAVPAAVFVPAGSGQVSFDVLGKRPAAAQKLTASLGDVRAQAAIAIDGLYLGEIFYGGGAHGQWIKLVNTSSVPIDLSGYVVGAGSAGYGETVAALTGLVDAGGCAVVGGPDSTADNGAPAYDQVLDFGPDLPAATGEAPAGVALFAGAAAAGTPLDAVVVGPGDAAGLAGPDGTAATPAVPAVDPGSSLARQRLDTWSVSAMPAPSDCPTLR